MAVITHLAAGDVTELMILNSGHWPMEEQPGATIAADRFVLAERT